MTAKIEYKGETLATVKNATKTMTTAGKYMEDDVAITDSIDLQTKTKTYTPSETQQTETITADAGKDGLDEVGVTVGAISSTYVGTGITRRSSTDLSASGATVTAPAGYYENPASKAVASGTAGTPTATKGTVSGHAVSVTPKVTNTTGYITGGTKTGTAVSVAASELVSGTKSITANDTGIDVTNYAAVDVAVPSVTPTLQTKTKTYTPSTSAQTENITADAGYDGLQEVDVTVSAMPTGSATPPEVTDTGASITSNGTNNITLSKIISLTPQVTPGYIAAGTAANRNVVLTASANVKGATTYPASTSDQTIAANTWLTGAQTIKGYAVQAKEFTSNGTYTPDAGFNGFYTVTVNVAGGGGASNIVQGTFTTGSTRNTKGTATIPYSGTGYPIAMFVYIDGGPYNNTSGGNTTWYNSLNRYDCGFYSMVKSEMNTTPTYAGTGTNNYGTVTVIYKNSTSSATSYTRTSSMAANTYTAAANTAAGSTQMVKFKGNGTTISYFIGNLGSGSIGFPPSTKMAYIVIYSS